VVVVLVVLEILQFDQVILEDLVVEDHTMEVLEERETLVDMIQLRVFLVLPPALVHTMG